jgi:hypothetical protein
MSNSNKAIHELKNLMVKFGFMNQELLSFKTTEDVILQTEKLEKGNKIFKINDSYELSSIENGTYRLKENFEVEVKNDVIEAVKEIFLEAVLEDGTKIKIEGDVLQAGAKVVVVQDDSEIPAPDGEHILNDGTKLKTKDGLIEVVMEVAGESPEAPETPEAPELEVEVPLAPSLAMEKEVLEMVKDFVSKIGQKMSEMESQMSKLENQFQSFSKEPAGKKISDGKTEFNKTNDDVFEDPRIATIMALRNKK